MKQILLFTLLCALLSSVGQTLHSEEQTVLLNVEPLEYSLDIAVDYDSAQVSGTCMVTVKNTSDTPTQHIPFLLYRLHEVKSVTDGNSRDLTYKQTMAAMKGWEAIEMNFLVISSEEAMQPGELRTISIEYGGPLKGYAEQGWRYVMDNVDRDFTIMRLDGFGYPVLGIPDENAMYKITGFRFDYTMNITVPKGLVVANGGELTGKEESGSTVCYSYSSIKPSWRMDIAIADYGILEKDENKVFFFKQDIDGAGYVLNAMEKSIETYSEWFGLLKDYHGFSIIEVPEGYGGQSDVTAIMQTADNFKNPESVEGVYHELSHQWNVQTLDDKPCRLESEGLAQFLQSLLREELEGNTGAVDEAAEIYRERFRKVAEKTPSFLTVPICDYGLKNMTDYSYTNGMLFFDLLYRLCGKSEFNHIIRTFLEKYNTTGASLEDFTMHIMENSSTVSDNFIQDWIYTLKAAELIVGTLSLDEITLLYR